MRRLPALFAILLAIPLAAACTDPGPPDDRLTPGAEQTQAAQTAAASGTSTPAPTPTPDFRGVTSNVGGTMVLATTSAPLDTGLLDQLAPLFTKLTGTEVQVIAASTGKVLEMAQKGTADVILSDSPAADKPFIDSGDLVGAKLVMHNDMIMVGPATDPAKVKGSRDMNTVMKNIANTGPFVSRGDDSAVNRMELALWQAAGVDVKAVKGRTETGQGGAATLTNADQKGAYTLSDRSTYIALKKNLKLEVLFEGDPSLISIYHVYVVSADKHPNVKKSQAEAWASFMVAPATQQIIADFKKAEVGQALFTADAGKPETSIGR